MSNIRIVVRSVYDIQKLRIQVGNRIVGNWKAKLGQAPGESENTLDDISKALLAKIRATNKLITTGAIDDLEHGETAAQKKEKKLAGIVSKLLDKHYSELVPKGTMPIKSTFKGDPIISDYTELCMIQQYKELEQQEARHFRSLANALEDYPIYKHFLEPIRGCGPAMAGVIISEIDIHKAKYPSSLHMLAGLDVAGDGKGRSRRKEHLVERDYLDKEGKPAKKMSITFNPFLKTKLYVLAGCFIKSGGPYRQIYDNYKNRLENHPMHQSKTKGHRHAMSQRYMLKILLIDLYNAWRPLEGLIVAPTYAEAKLGLVHGSPANQQATGTAG